jgi:hypothetical protein
VSDDASLVSCLSRCLGVFYDGASRVVAKRQEWKCDVGLNCLAGMFGRHRHHHHRQGFGVVD